MEQEFKKFRLNGEKEEENKSDDEIVEIKPDTFFNKFAFDPKGMKSKLKEE